MQSTQKPNPDSSSGFFKKFLQKAALGGFLFFLIKGLIWLGVAAGLWFGINEV